MMHRSATANLVVVVGTLLVSGGSGSAARQATAPAAVQPAADCTPAFTDPVIQPLPGGPRFLVFTDLNNDRIQDLVATTEASGNGDSSIAVLLGDGGGFGAPATTVIGGLPRALSEGDFNSDGRRDVVMTSSEFSNDAGSVTVLFGDGAGGFSGSLVRAVGRNPFAVIAGDFTQDGKADILVSSEYAEPSTVALLRGDGAGNFDPLVPLQVGLRPMEFAAGDFNGDGRLDLAAAATDFLDLNGFVEVRLANAAGAFDSPVSFEVGWQTNGIGSGDFNEDGHLDLVAGNLDATVSVLLGDGAGGFAPQIVAPTSWTFLDWLVVADVDGDGHLDVANNGIDVLLGDGTGGLTLLRRFHPSGAGLGVADVNADGRLDLATGVTSPQDGVAVIYGRCGTPADVSLEMTESRDLVLAGQHVDYTFTITNHGSEAVSVIGTFTFFFPSFIGPAGSLDVSQGGCRSTSTRVPGGASLIFTCDFGAIAPSGVVTVDAYSFARSTGVLKVTASLEMDNPHFDPNPADNSASETTTVVFVGGVQFNLGATPGGAAALSWNGGGWQAGFLIGRWAGGETTYLPANGVLSREATSFVDTGPVAGNVNCYSLAPVDAEAQPFGRSHLLCMAPGSASPPDMLPDFTVSGSLGAFRFSWTSPGGQTGYVIYTHPLDGSAPSHRFVAPGTTEFFADAQSACYSVGPLDGSTVRGHSSVLCAIPGFATLYP